MQRRVRCRLATFSRPWRRGFCPGAQPGLDCNLRSERWVLAGGLQRPSALLLRRRPLRGRDQMPGCDRVWRGLVCDRCSGQQDQHAVILDQAAPRTERNLALSSLRPQANTTYQSGRADCTAFPLRKTSTILAAGTSGPSNVGIRAPESGWNVLLGVVSALLARLVAVKKGDTTLITMWSFASSLRAASDRDVRAALVEAYAPMSGTTSLT